VRRPHPLLFALALAAAILAGCRREEQPPAPAAPPPAPTFTMADLAAATAFDARVARVSLVATSYQSTLLFEPADLRGRTDRMTPQLEAAVTEMNAALAAIRNPADRALAAPVAAAASRWPALLARARDEVLTNDPKRTQAGEALAAGDEEIARALLAYRRFRSGWTIVDAPLELPEVVRWLEARRDLERLESTLGERMPADGGVSLKRPDAFRSAVREAAARGRTGALALDPDRQRRALEWIDAQQGAIEAMLELAAADKPPLRAKASLVYQARKVDVLDAGAAYTALTAERR
jgi:hypothetical protein